MLSELELGETPHFGASPQTQNLLFGAILLIMGKGFEAARLRQARLRVAVRRGKRTERTHAVLIESNANEKTQTSRALAGVQPNLTSLC